MVQIKKNIAKLDEAFGPNPKSMARPEEVFVPNPKNMGRPEEVFKMRSSVGRHVMFFSQK